MNRYLASGLLSAALVVFLTGCLGEEAPKGQPQGGMPPPAVQTLSVEAGNIALAYEYPATIQSVQQVDVVARVAGLLEAKHFTEGQKVRKGELLYEIDPAKYQATFNVALAQLGVEEASLKAAALSWERTKTLFEANALSKQEYDNALKAYEASKASVAAAKASLESAKIDLGYTKIYAPSSGVIGLGALDVGSYITAANTPLVRITQTDPVYVDFSLPDRDFLRHKENLENATVRVSVAGKMVENQGKITFTDAVVQPLTSTVQMRATFENSNNALIPGLFARVRLEGLSVASGVSIPQSALLQDASGSFVYVHKEGKAVKVPVSIDQPREGMFILSSGLQGGEALILNNLSKLRPNAPVRVENP